MLVLSRRINERVVMPTLGVIVQVVSAKPGVVRLGIEAPDAVPVFREEVLERLDPAARLQLQEAATRTAERLNEQVRLMGEALQTAAANLTLLRGQVELGRTENLAAALERLSRDLRTATDLTASGADSGLLIRNAAAKTVKSKDSDCIVY